MGVIGYKIWSDLWSNKARTLQVVLIIAVGAAAIGMIVTTRTLVISGMEDIWGAVNPAMITMYTDPSVDDDIINALKGVDGVENVEGFATHSIEWRLSPDDEWSAARLIARDDYKNQHYTIATMLSVPAGRMMTEALGSALSSQLVYIYKPTGTLYWLGIITVLAILASWLPAYRATRVSVRESLAYQ
ncbi:hypothetical protein QUF64_15435 [Anaerolineales bacterium HSG6]|nr:hypothetical protein [Anaerolineales bacterium HSG6]